MKEPNKGYSEAMSAAREFGAEARANHQKKILTRDDKENIAYYYGIVDDNWNLIEDEHKQELTKMFFEGWDVEDSYC